MPPMSAPPDDGFPDISRLLRPGSIAVIGASDRPGNFGGQTVRRLLKFGYPGEIWPVNPNAEAVAGLPCYSSPGDLPGAADLAVFAIPASAIPGSVAECAGAGIRHGVAYAGGFMETGGEGIALQRTLVEVCRQTGFTLCGPNCVGVINAEIPMTATFSTALAEIDRLVPGSISIVSQSGGLGTIALSLIHRAGFGVRYMISSGNEAVLTFADYLHALALDEGTRVIVGYLEGVTGGQKLLTALAEARDRDKPVILIKAGTTAASASAAQAHTGALAGEDRVYDAIFREMGVIRVYSVEDLVDVSLLASGFNREKLSAGVGVAVVTFGGGGGVLATDQCAQHGLSTPPLSSTTVERLRELLVPVASAANPMDLTPQTVMRPEWLEKLPQALDVVAADPQIDAVLCTLSSLAVRAVEICDVFSGFWRRSSKAVCVSWMDPPAGVPERLAAAGIHAFSEQARAVRALSHLVRHQHELSRPQRCHANEPLPFDWRPFVASPTLGSVVPEHVCHSILSAAGLPVAAGRLSTSEAEAVGAAEIVGFPIVLKGVSPQVTHRAVAGLLAIGLRTVEEVRAAYRRLTDRAREIDVRLDGLYVQHMVDSGTELLVSAFRDPLFGTMVTCGAGGNLTEALDDIVVERAPVDAALALDMLRRLRIVRRARHPEAELAAEVAAEYVAQFSKLAASAPWGRFTLEVNPVIWNPDRAVAVDGLLIIENP